MSANVQTLLEALPYIREFHGRTVVIKYGGAAMRDEELREAFATDVVLLKYVGLNPVIVHGGGPDITSYMERLGMEVRFVEGVRVSDPETVEVAKMVLLGKVNSDIVSRLNRHGQPAVGLSGEDGTLFEVRPHPNADQVGFVGEVERVDVDVLNHIAEDYIPVVASAGTDREGNSYNVNADTAAGKVAAALRAYKAIFLTDVRRLARRPRRSRLARLARHRERGGGRARGGRGRHAAEARSLHRGDRRRGAVGAHHRRLQAPLPAPGAVHGRGDRHDGHSHEPRGAAGVGGAVCDADLCAGAGRVRARLGRPAVGRRRQGVPRLLRRALGPQRGPLPSADRRRDQQTRRSGWGASPTSTTRSRRCGSASGSPSSSLGGKVFLCNSGAEANECAIKLARKRAHARGVQAPEIVVLHGRLSRSHAGSPRGDAEARSRGPVRAAARRLRGRAARRSRRACGPRSASAPPP